MGAHYASLFGDDPGLKALRKAYAIPVNTIKTPERQRLMNSFFFWAAWACGTQRPGSTITYTQNWPPETLIDNRPTGSVIVSSVVSFVVLLAGLGAMIWYFAAQRLKEEDETFNVPQQDPLLALKATPSMRAILKYFWIVAALIVVQVGWAPSPPITVWKETVFTASHLSKWLPYAVARTWHTQLGIFWIATAWLATGLFVAPAVSGYEPKGQRLGVNFLFVCLLIIVAGSLAGEWMGVQQKLG